VNILRPQFTKQGQGLGRNPVAEKGAPVSFGTQLANLTVAQQTAVLNTQALQAGYRTPYYIDEIRMTAFTGESAGSAAVTALAYSLRAKFQTGRHAFSKGPIPLSLYAPVFLRAGYATSYLNGIFAFFRGVVEVRWVLPKPLYMEPGDVIQCYLERSNQFNTGPQYASNNFNVTYVGRAIAPGKKPPPCKYVPWVAFYDHPTTVASGYSNAGESFRNPFTIPLNVHRFTQQTYVEVNTTPGQFLQWEGGRGPTNPSSFGETSFTQIRLYDSLGYAIVKEFAPIGEVMDLARQAWTFSRPIGPREQFDAEFSSTPITNTPFITRYDTLLGMVAHREEAI